MRVLRLEAEAFIHFIMESVQREHALRMLRTGMGASFATECGDLQEDKVARLAEEARRYVRLATGARSRETGKNTEAARGA